MIYQTADISGPYLDMAVAMAEGYKFGHPVKPRADFWLFPLAMPRSVTLGSVGWNRMTKEWGVNVRRYSKEDRHSGPIIDREKIGTIYDSARCRWVAQATYVESGVVVELTSEGETRLEAAMRLHAIKFHGNELRVLI